MQGKINISEIFPAIQGEGFMAGVPVLFVRTSGCNTKCPWCDTSYHENGTEYNLEEVVDKIRDSNLTNIVFTGGEPTLQIDEIKEIIDYLPLHSFQLETNGSLYNDLVKKFDFISVSPKKQLIFRTNSYIKYRMLPQTTFKFVYENKNDKWWEEFINRINIPNDAIFIMPEGATRDEQIKKMPEVIEYCLQNKFNFSPRLHILAYDNKCGV